MKIAEFYNQGLDNRGGEPAFSCEFFAPKTQKGFDNLYKVFDKLKAIDPAFYSVTYGAGGSSVLSTLQLVEQIQNVHGITAMPHLTSVEHSRLYLEDYIRGLCARGIKNILALRGDTPGGGKFVPHRDGFKYSSEVVELARGFDCFCIGVAGHPEGHPDSVSLEEDVRALKIKVDAGAEFIITQFFFRNEYYFRFVEAARKEGITVPIIPGVIPFVNAELVMRFAKINQTEIPPDLLAEMEACGSDREKATELGVRQATEQCRELLTEGVPGIHFYTLNNSAPTIRVIESVGK